MSDLEETRNLLASMTCRYIQSHVKLPYDEVFCDIADDLPATLHRIESRHNKAWCQLVPAGAIEALEFLGHTTYRQRIRAAVKQAAAGCNRDAVVAASDLDLLLAETRES